MFLSSLNPWRSDPTQPSSIVEEGDETDVSLLEVTHPDVDIQESGLKGEFFMRLL